MLKLCSQKSKKKLATLRINEDNAENMEDKDISIWKSNRKTGKTGKSLLRINVEKTKEMPDKDKDASPQKWKRKKTTLPINDRNMEDMEDRDESLQESNKKIATVHMDEGANTTFVLRKKRISKGNTPAMSPISHKTNNNVSPSLQ